MHKIIDEEFVTILAALLLGFLLGILFWATVLHFFGHN